jgi:hypothetical protein
METFETRRAQLRGRLNGVPILPHHEARKELAVVAIETLSLIDDQYREPDLWEKASMRLAADYLSASSLRLALAGTELRHALVPRDERGSPPSSHSEAVAARFDHLGLQAELAAIRDNP